MKIAAIELEYHLLDLDSFCRIFENSNHDITLYVNERMHNDLKSHSYYNKFKWNIKSNQESVKDFLNHNLVSINTSDYIYFNTIASNYKTYYKLHFKPKCILRIHNANTYLKPFQNLYIKLNFFNIYKALSYIVREFIGELEFYYLPRLLKKIDYYCFVDENVKNYVIRNNYISSNKAFPTIPSSIFNKDFPQINSNSAIKICIPGIIDERKKDYLPIIDSIKLLQYKINNPFEIILLGKPEGNYGKWVLSEFNNLQSPKIKITFYNEFVSQEIYDFQMSNSDILITPLLKKTIFRIYKEEYGKTKASGSIGEMVKYGVPNLIPDYIYFDDEMSKLVDRYSNSIELSNYIINYINNPSHLIKRTRDVRNFIKNRYNVSYVLSEINTFINKEIQY